MNIPGTNLLNLALTVIKKQTFLYFPYVSRTLQPNGVYKQTYAAGQPVTGSVQPVPRQLYANMGLDFQKNYHYFFIPRHIIDVTRNVSGDQFQFEGMNFQAVSKTPWHGIDGWDQVLCIEVTDY
jgi:hypothetical protein